MYKAEKARQMLQLRALKACFHVGHDSPANLLLGTSCTSMQSGELLKNKRGQLNSACCVDKGILQHSSTCPLLPCISLELERQGEILECYNLSLFLTRKWWFQKQKGNDT